MIESRASITLQSNSLRLRRVRLEPRTRVVLLVVDMLGDFLARWPASERRALTSATNELVAHVRDRGDPVLWVRQEFRSDLADAFLEMRDRGVAVTIEGTPGCQLVPELVPAAHEVVIVKKRYSAFFGTRLDEILASLSPNVLVIAGVNTHACIRMTAIDAYQRDWRVVVAADCVASRDAEHHAITLRYLGEQIGRVLTNDELFAELSAG
jgi:nicotinamidase-related amidase